MKAGHVNGRQKVGNELNAARRGMAEDEDDVLDDSPIACNERNQYDDLIPLDDFKKPKKRGRKRLFEKNEQSP